MSTSSSIPWPLRRSRLALAALFVTACGGAAAGLHVGSDGSTDGASPARSGLELERRSHIARLHAAAAHGLDPAAYGVDDIAEARRAGAPAERVDALIRQGLDRLRTDLARGATPADRRPEPYRVDEAAPDGDLDLPTPTHPEYLRLVEWLAIYERRARDGGWPDPGAAPDRALRVGDVDPAVGRLRARLAASVDPSEAALAGAGARTPDRFDDGLEQAVRHAQARFGLEPDGVVGSNTWAALSVPAEARVDALKATLEHWRWLPRSFGAETTLWIDVPSFEMNVLEGGRSVLDMAVVVGAPSTPTPPLVDTLESVVVNPAWNVPSSILLGELAPAQADDPGHLAAGGYEVLDGSGDLVDPAAVDWSRPGSWPAGLRVRQRPGPTNALGAIKFLFPNVHAVYLHDSPARHLYGRADRALSHGCVRLSDPWALAELLADRRVVDLDVDEARRSSARRAVAARSPVPVFFTHFAARADEPARAPRFAPPIPGRIDTELSGPADPT